MDDRISALPDDILSHIISFLPSEDLFATRIISKRWRPLWLINPSPNLDFDDESFFKKGESYATFIDMVNSTIHARRLHQPINSFRLRCYCDDSMFCFVVKTWLIKAAERGMKYLDLYFSHKMTFGCFAFHFKNLVVLKLKGVNVVVSLSAANLPLVRTLHLDGVYFIEYGSIIQILNACPLLEDLVAKDLSFGYVSDENVVECKMLTNLFRADISTFSRNDVPLKAFYNVEFLRIGEMCGYVPEFLNLTHLEIVYGGWVNWDYMSDVLGHCHKLLTFVLEMPLTPDIFYFCLDPISFPKSLSLQFKNCTITNYRGHEYELQFLQCVLQISTSLESMRIYSLPSMNSAEKLEMQKKVMASQRVLQHVKFILIDYCSPCFKITTIPN